MTRTPTTAPTAAPKTAPTAVPTTAPTAQQLTITAVRLTPILVADPPLLNTQGVHQPYTPRLIIEVTTAAWRDRRR